MSSISVNIMTATDRDYYEVLRAISKSEVAKSLGLSGLTFVFPESIREELKHTGFEAADADENLQLLLNANGNTVSKFTLGGGKSNVAINRQFNYQEGTPRKQPTIAAQFDVANSSLKEHHPVLLAEMQNAIAALNPCRIAAHLDADSQSHFEARNSALTRLETLQATLLHDFEKIKREHYADLGAKRDALENEYAAKASDLDEQHRERLLSIEKERELLEVEKARLDDRSSTHVRRELREKLKEILTDRQSKFSLSQDTSKRRRWVLVGYMVILACLAGLGGYFLWVESDSSGTPNYWNIGRQVAFALGFFVTAGFFVKWMHTWAQQHAEEEFRLKQLEIDLDRASWVVEMAFEWDESKQNPIPEKLLDTLSANLFGDSLKLKDAVMTPGEAIAKTLAGLPNAAAELSFPGGKLSLDKKGMKEITKSATSIE
ncbi:hypothetical protein [Rosistilla oblonga]|uniref:hypothetical protein n=1 Tax=Rosistilla oblonga TaxID=2527990 RepID=UPI003A983D70